MLKRLLVVLALPLALAAQETKGSPEASQSPVRAELKVGTAVEKKDIVGAADQFKIAPNTKLYAWARIDGIPAGGKVTLAFFRGETKAFARELPVGGSPWRLNAYKTFRTGDGGDWTARALGANGAQIASVAFKVEIQQ